MYKIPGYRYYADSKCLVMKYSNPRRMEIQNEAEYQDTGHNPLTSPTCDVLGINLFSAADVFDHSFTAKHEMNSDYSQYAENYANNQFSTAKDLPVFYGSTTIIHDSRLIGVNADPFAPECRIPLPSGFCDFPHIQISNIRRRNERERERVRCVNDGYSRLRRHLPIENRDKRISKVETLRVAVRYIQYLQDILAGTLDAETQFNWKSK